MSDDQAVGGCEPWNNGYERDGSAELLLRRLQGGPLSDDQVHRFCLKEAGQLLNAEEKQAFAKNATMGLLDFVASFGRSPAFSDAVRASEQQAEELRQTIEWSQVPPHLQELCARRAHYLLNYTTENGWIERATDGASWRITERGNQLLADGGFNMR